MTAAIYQGSVSHHRYVERRHNFEYRLYMLWLPIEEVDQPQYRWSIISRGKFAPISVRAEDYMASRQEATLTEKLRAEVLEKTGKSWTGTGYLLAQPRHFGFIMNPLALYYLYGADQELQYVVGEITNTPWGERHCYVFDFSGKPLREKVETFQFKKIFHVSPFLPMEMDYTWKLSSPGEKLSVGIWNHQNSRLDFDAFLNLSRRSLNFLSIMWHMIKFPLMTFKVVGGIYWNAGVLYLWKRVTFYNHPKLSMKESSQ